MQLAKKVYQNQSPKNIVQYTKCLKHMKGRDFPSNLSQLHITSVVCNEKEIDLFQSGMIKFSMLMSETANGHSERQRPTQSAKEVNPQLSGFSGAFSSSGGSLQVSPLRIQINFFVFTYLLALHFLFER